jgi:hypothetical protein
MTVFQSFTGLGRRETGHYVTAGETPAPQGENHMPPLTVTNWFGDLVSHPQVVVEAHSAQDVVAILKDPVKYPSPVRAIGQNHSTAPCGVVEGGTLVLMSSMNQIVQITDDAVTAQAGAIYIDVAQELQKKNLQFYVNTEIGNLSMGSAACCGTKDGSMPGEYGQVGSYLTQVELVLPSGDILEVDESQPELLAQIRSSYGLLGIVTAATFKVRPILPMAVYHESFTLEDFVQKLPSLFARNESMMYYVFPFDNQITVEFRKYNPGASGTANRVIWPLRNYLWGTTGPAFCRQHRRYKDSLRRDRWFLRHVAFQADEHNPQRLHDRQRTDDPLSQSRHQQQLHVQLLGISRNSLYRHSHGLFQVRAGLLPKDWLSQQHAQRWIPCGPGSKIPVLLFLRRQCHDGGPGFHGQSRLGRIPRCLQRALQQPRRDSSI